jgi:hypothetical protein
MASVTEQLENLAPPSDDGGDAMQEDYEADAEADDAAALEAKHAAENAAAQQMAAAIPPAAQVAVGGAGFVTETVQGFIIRRYHDTDPQEYAEVHADGNRYLVGWLKNQKNFGVAYDENTRAKIGQLDSNGAIIFDDTREPATVSLSATQAAKPGEIQSAVKVQQAVEKINKATVKTEVKAGRDAELAVLYVQKAELEHENANIDNKAAVALHEQALVRLFLPISGGVNF